jgi:hypothetical protein
MLDWISKKMVKLHTPLMVEQWERETCSHQIQICEFSSTEEVPSTVPSTESEKIVKGIEYIARIYFLVPNGTL